MAFLLLLLAASLVGTHARPASQTWQVESSVVNSKEDTVTLLRFDYDGANMSEGDEQLVLAHLASSMHRLGLPKISLAVTLEKSAIRVALRDPVAAAKIMQAVRHGHLQPPPNPSPSWRSTLGWQAGLFIALAVAFIAVVIAAAVVQSRRAAQEHTHRAQLKRGSTCSPASAEPHLVKRGSLLA